MPVVLLQSSDGAFSAFSVKANAPLNAVFSLYGAARSAAPSSFSFYYGSRLISWQDSLADLGAVTHDNEVWLNVLVKSELKHPLPQAPRSASSSSSSSSLFSSSSSSSIAKAGHCGGKQLTPEQISASTFRQLDAQESTTSFSSMLDVKASLSADSQGRFDIKLGTTRSSNSKTGHTHHCECTSGTNSSCKWKRVFELCISIGGDYVWAERRGQAVDDHDHALLVAPKTPQPAAREPAAAAPAPQSRSPAQSYSRDPSNSAKKSFHARTAPTPNARCIRCQLNFEKGDLKLMFESFDNNHPVTRGYHPACFRKFPPRGLNLSSFVIQWDATKRNAACEVEVEGILRGDKKRKANAVIDLCEY
jgi:hypothetical protein